MIGTKTYYVWRRSDGYVSCTARPPSNRSDSFDVLLVTQDWPEAHARIEAERDEAHFALVASWNADLR